ncbi:hypothetical protein D7B24_008913 [Verticillium nonalfalfae]|uniref:BRCT domain-containing protein n=1 Tax=Verticillium nonalfalfae TaxID=1051616 RepID=A0A3M9Y3W7_9PEZI|nr:uncharacterized protein D7B24_008913 [Verticillium nonalfalfae]RNJ55137.1 hypothetical protein D7B24_008913 [Verticillium nonalfalfae]
MDPQSPPKRMTRARAAAKASDAGPKTTKIMTAAAKAKAAPAATRATASSKRKTRSDEDEEDHNEASSTEAPARATRARGRPKKAAEEPGEEEEATSSSAPGRATRARAAARKAAADVPKPEPTKETALKATRGPGRPRRLATQEDAPAASEPPKRTTRTRAATVTAAKPVVRKKVTFEEPEKENVNPDEGKKTPGLRGRPVRKPPVPKAARPTPKTAATAAAKETKETKAPLSPKKVTQMPHSRDDSEDELCQTPVKALMKSPVKPPSSALGSFKKLEPRPRETEPAGDVADDEGETPEITLSSPAKRPPTSPSRDNTMKSPAKRADGVTILRPASAMKPSTNGETTPFKASLLNSPAKRSQSAVKSLNLPTHNRSTAETSRSPFKASLLQSPAKRPVIPFKTHATPRLQNVVESPLASTRKVPGASAEAETSSQATQSARTKAFYMASPAALPSAMSSSEKLMFEEQGDDAMDQVADQILLQEPSTLNFPGRLSAVLPRYADPALKDNLAILHENLEDEVREAEANSSAQAVSQIVDELTPDEDVAADEVTDEDGDSIMTEELEVEYQENEPPVSAIADDTEGPVDAPAPPMGVFALREKDTTPYDDMDSDSDDEIAHSGEGQSSPTRAVPATPTPALSSRRSMGQSSNKLGFTPLAQQLSAWSAASPAKQTRPSAPKATVESPKKLAQSPAASVRIDDSPAKSTFFEDEMTIRAEFDLQQQVEAAIEDEIMAELDDPEFDDMMITQEDMQLAAEADEMSLLEPSQVEEMAGILALDDSLSEASQEYGDENEMPVDPAMNDGLSIPPTTPLRTLTREFHTVSKVPLKAADDSTPRPKKKRAASISRLPVSRPTQGLTRSATVISYSPMKNNRPALEPKHDVEQEEPLQSAPVTPTKSDIWSTLGTPARTPRRDVDPALLSGAVVFVDVHTSEGDDASGIFVELLAQMGARSVKNWDWNPDSAGPDSSKIGITHVVYKDGGQRTLEKVRQAKGVVQCVGVSWVLDCERENEWLDEAPYNIDTSSSSSSSSRGGARRRKSMMVTSPTKGSRDAQTAPNTPMNRRESTAWEHSPSDLVEDDDQEWQTLLTPVPQTPAPDALARYAADLTPGTPTATLSSSDDSPLSEPMGMKTCPPKPNAYSEMGHGILDREKDDNVVRRLMAARRKSLQFAPKIGSPLARAW